jgi:hypothetical protein
MRNIGGGSVGDSVGSIIGCCANLRHLEQLEIRKETTKRF